MRGISCAGEFSCLDINAARTACTEQSELHLMSKSRLMGYTSLLYGESPVLAVKLQDMFGLTDTPHLALSLAVIAPTIFPASVGMASGGRG